MVLFAAAITLLAAAEPAQPWHTEHWPAAHGQTLAVLLRGALLPPLRYRVVVLPGSGCAGMAAWASRYFAGLHHAEVWVLHKPGVTPTATTPPSDCPADFVQQDSLSWWLEHAQAALQSGFAPLAHRLPTVLVGISEGGELLPQLAPQIPALAGLVLISAPGIDPREAAALQAARLGQTEAWQALAHSQASDLPDQTLYQGRSLRYWRDLWHWPVAQPLRDGPWPLLQVWGDEDALIPVSAYERLPAQLQGRAAVWCSYRMAHADHGLQRGSHDGLQPVWAWLENWARTPHPGWCSHMPSSTISGQKSQVQR